MSNKSIESRNLLQTFRKRKRKILLAFIDALLIICCVFLSYLIVLDRGCLRDTTAFAITYSVATLLCFLFLGVYNSIWRFASAWSFVSLYLGILISSLICWSIGNGFWGLINDNPLLPKLTTVYYVFNFLISLFLLSASRIAYRLLYDMLTLPRTSNKQFSDNDEKPKQLRTAIVGAGKACHVLLQEMKGIDDEHKVVCIIDDDENKINCKLDGIMVLGPIKNVEDICQMLNIDCIIVAIPSADEITRSRIIQLCSKASANVQIMPDVHSLISSSPDGARKLQLRELNIEDLLGRKPVILDKAECKELINGNICMVTGGGGSIGSELCRQIMAYKPEKLVIIDIYENNAYEIQQELIMKYGANTPLIVRIASVRDYDKMEQLIEKYKPSVIFHAAAHKHVPLMETDPEESVKNNIAGTYNMAFLAKKYKVKKFVLISTDKAVNPTNVMGATKRFCEIIVQHFSMQTKDTKYACVRFGNVLGSNGSVIPLFEKQIKENKEVTLTDPNITRFFMTISEAVSLVMTAGAISNGGEVFVLDMGTPMKIMDLAVNLIKLHGYVPEKDVKIKIIGLRPGEKLYEEVLMNSDTLQRTCHGKIFVEANSMMPQDFEGKYRALLNAAFSNDSDVTVEELKKAVSTFNHKPGKLLRR